MGGWKMKGNEKKNKAEPLGIFGFGIFGLGTFMKILKL